MRGRTARLLPRVLWGTSLAMLVVAPVLGYANRSVEKPDVFTSVVLLGMAGFATVGALIASRHPENPIGWLFCFIAFSLIFFGLREVYVVRGLLVEPGSLPAVTFVAWLSGLLALVALLSFPLTFLLFPDGKVPSPRWRPVVWAALAACALVVVGAILAPGKLGGFALSRIRIPNPTAVESLRTTANVLISVGALAMVGVTVASVVGLVLRFRRASGEERQQIRWLAYIGAMLLAVPLIGIASVLVGVDLGNVVFPAFFLLLLAGIPAASGIAILKYRLFDLDLVIKKTLVFGILVVLLMGVAALFLLGLSLPFVQPNRDQPAALILTGAALGLL